MLRFFFFLSFILCCIGAEAGGESSSNNNNNNNNESDDSKETVSKWISQARGQYKTLSDPGKFASGAVVGFGASKVAVKSAVKFVKISGAFFIATEILEATGILDNMDGVFDSSADGMEREGIKRRLLNKISDFRTFIRSWFDEFNLKRYLEQDKMGTLGCAAGAFFGFLL